MKLWDLAPRNRSLSYAGGTAGHRDCAGGRDTRRCPPWAAAGHRGALSRSGRSPRQGGLLRPDDTFAAGRRRYHAGPILGRLIRLRLAAEPLLGVAALALFAPGLNFILGQARGGGRVGVTALARLPPEFWGRPADRQLFLQRAIKEAIHELGHTYGLE